MSRCCGRNSIWLLRDFDEKLLTMHPCQFLQAEEDRLKILDKVMEQWWVGKEEQEHDQLSSPSA